jgi:hypothetical protein
VITPTPYNECTQLVQKILWFNWMKVTLRSRQTTGTYIHSKELVWPRTVIVQSWCNRVEWLYWVDATVHCTVYSKIHLVGGFVFLLYIAQSRQSARLFLQSSELAPQPQEIVSPLLWFGGSYRPVKVTLKVIKRRLKVLCWSCDGVPLKWNLKKFRASSLSLRIKWAYSRLSIRIIGQYLKRKLPGKRQSPLF